MFMSIFSSFDALFAESFGHKVGFFPAPPPKEAKVNASPVDRRMETSSPIIRENLSKSGERNSSESPACVQKSLRQEQVKQQRRPRFAPEFDGVYCFETIVPY
ncbi:Glycerol-3-phosphate O-acyltransferase [Actinidia chinensis var. chinensis]|uniref:Glycerol-3-phosphate O-acyltransferase n=1 Tax=Actinidia chinensis var. chinensis TaxID=1590841 RepID=A0A2R6RQH4_ACTCC|nr:Glycerol-3-phosphate O-acyltransferase [Actinidia chinensis var. chinensis]